jgi:molybdopterin molybdotransferase
MSGLPLDEAVNRLLAAAESTDAETVAAAAAGGRIAAEDVYAPGPVPGFARSAMDGYLCHDADVTGAARGEPAVLRITGGTRPGDVPGGGPARGEAWWITTGAPLPRRGDRVLPLETVRRDGEHLRVETPPGAKRHIAAPGEEIAAGARLASRGAVIGAAAAGALAACGVRELRVYRLPRVAVVATGDELVEAGEAGVPLPAGRIVNSNAVMLLGLVRAAGCAVDYAGIVRDDPDAIRARFAALAARADVVLSTGGVSVGRYDLVHRAWLDLGAARVAGRVSLKPGGPFFAGRLGATWGVGLSGTPAACLAAFHLLARPLLARLSGRRHAVRPTYDALLLDGVERPAEQTRALWGRAAGAPGGTPAVRVIGHDAAGTVTALLDANVIVLLPAGTPPLAPGSRATALALEAQECQERLEIRPAAPAPAVLGVVGASGAGKTRLVVALLRALSEDGLRVAAVKHAAHGFALDRAGSDSERMASAGAAAVVLAGPEETAVRLARPVADAAAAAALAVDLSRPAAPLDLVIVEGFAHPSGAVVRVGPAKPERAGGEVIAVLPAAGQVDGEAWEAAARRAAGAVRAWLAPRRARAP